MELDALVNAPDLEIVETVHGPLACFRLDTGVSHSLRTYGEFGAAEVEVYRGILRPGDVFVDVGANIGVFSAALQRDNRDIEIFAFEPQPAFHSVATLNLMNGGGARVLPYAVGAEDRLIDVPEIDIGQSGNYGGFSISRTSARTLPTPMIRLDSFLSARQKHPRLVKIDVEGMEAEVIEGLSHLFECDLILSIEADKPESVADWLPRLLAAKAQCYYLNMRSISSSNPKFDKTAERCNVFSPHIFACFGTPDPAFAARYKPFAITDLAQYQTRFTGPVF